MSGIEVAGLVLGGLPLLITALEHYGEGVRTIQYAFNFTQEFIAVGRRMRVEFDIFRNAIELLLHGCVEDGTLAELVNEPGGNAWSQKSVEFALQQKLQRSYSTYFETVVSLNRAMHKFKDKLGLDENFKPPFSNEPRSFKEAYKRLRFALKRSGYMEILDEISKDNAALHRLSDQCRDLEVSRSSRTKMPDLSLIRKHASRVFEVLHKCLNASCKTSHRASLFIHDADNQRKRLHDEQGSGLSVSTFRVVLCHYPRGVRGSQAKHWICEEADIKVSESAAPNAPGGAYTHPDPNDVMVSPIQAKVRFAAPVTHAVKQRAIDHISNTNLKEIKDLCVAIPQLRNTTKSGIGLGYLLDASLNRCELGWPVDQLIDRDSYDSFSLADVLAIHKQNPFLKVALLRRIAANLALRILQLYDTPWLGSMLDRHRVRFFQKNGDLVIAHPFISADAASKCGGQATARTSQPHSLVRNQTLFSLGVLLIELCMEQPLSTLQTPCELDLGGAKHAVSDLLTANRVLDQVYDKAGTRYGDAVRRCIHCDFDQRHPNLDDVAFRRAVYDGVFMLLDEDAKQFPQA